MGHHKTHHRVGQDLLKGTAQVLSSGTSEGISHGVSERFSQGVTRWLSTMQMLFDIKRFIRKKLHYDPML